MTDHGTGDFTMNFTTAMPDTGYSAVGTAGYNSGQIVLGLTGSGTEHLQQLWILICVNYNSNLSWMRNIYFSNGGEVKCLKLFTHKKMVLLQ